MLLGPLFIGKKMVVTRPLKWSKMRQKIWPLKKGAESGKKSGRIQGEEKDQENYNSRE